MSTVVTSLLGRTIVSPGGAKHTIVVVALGPAVPPSDEPAIHIVIVGRTGKLDTLKLGTTTADRWKLEVEE